MSEEPISPRVTLVDPDAFQFIVQMISALANIVQLTESARKTSIASNPSWMISWTEQHVKDMRQEFRNAFDAFDELCGVYRLYEDSFQNLDGKYKVGFGTFVAFVTEEDAKSVELQRRKLFRAIDNIGHLTSEIVLEFKGSETVIKAFLGAAFLNYHDLNRLLRSDMSYTEITFELRSLKHKVSDFFDGVLVKLKGN
jgi:hypothetical protein